MGKGMSLKKTGKGVESKPKREPTNRFHRSEIRQMEKILEDGKDELLDQSFFQKLTEDFNRLPSRAGNKALQIEQVQRWFRKKKNPAAEASISPTSLEGLVDVNSLPIIVTPESFSDTPKGTCTGETDPAHEELEFEARSSRDNAWYDVTAFLSHRFLTSGESEVLIRYHGFGAEEDEWVNIKKNVRLRSVPFESSECRKIVAGDLVLCFWERNDQAKYFDAHIVEVQRKLHDIRGCRCIFSIRYDHDGSEEKVNLRRLCRRPKY